MAVFTPDWVAWRTSCQRQSLPDSSKWRASKWDGKLNFKQRGPYTMKVLITMTTMSICVCVYTNMLFTYLRILQCHYPFPINPSVHINREMLDMVLQQNWSEWWSSCCSDPFWVGLQFPMLGWPLTILNCNERNETMRMIWACTSFCNL